MDLEKYEKKHVRITDIYGQSLTGRASYGSASFLMHEYGGDEDGIFIEDCLICRSQVASIEEIEVHGTAELETERLILRRYRPEDADALYRQLGSDAATARYSGWNPYATPETARETVRRFLESYDDRHAYSWVMDLDDVVVGTIGAYDYEDGQIEVGFSVVPAWQGRGLATEALKAVLEYLTGNEGIARVSAWCAAENTASRRVLEKAGMRPAGTEKDGVTAGGRTYDKLTFVYTRGGGYPMNSIFTRVSIRKYEDRPVEKEKIEAMLRAAMQAPSATNQQPWEFYVVTNREKLAALAEVSPYAGMTKDAPAAIVSVYRKACRVPAYAQIDLAIAMENLWLETDAQGLGGVWLGIAPQEERMKAVEEIIGTPDTVRAFAIFPFGYPAEERKQQDRFDAALIHYIE